VYYSLKQKVETGNTYDLSLHAAAAGSESDARRKQEVFRRKYPLDTQTHALAEWWTQPGSQLQIWHTRTLRSAHNTCIKAYLIGAEKDKLHISSKHVSSWDFSSPKWRDNTPKCISFPPLHCSYLRLMFLLTEFTLFWNLLSFLDKNLLLLLLVRRYNSVRVLVRSTIAFYESLSNTLFFQFLIFTVCRSFLT
jgi:hypothetical protein